MSNERTLTSNENLLADLEAAAVKWALEKTKYHLDSLRDARRAVFSRLCAHETRVSHGGGYQPVRTGNGIPLAPPKHPNGNETSEQLRVRLAKDIYDDGQDHHPPSYVGRKGDVVVIHSIQTAVVSHRGTGDGFVVHDGELELSGSEKAGACPPIDAKLNASIEAVAKVLQEEAASDPTFPVRGVANYAGLAGRIIRAVAGSKEKS